MTLEEQMSLLFVEEAAELLADFEQALLLLESLPDDLELLNRVFRCAHTLKGNSKILGFDAIAGFTHELEDLLDRLRKQELVVTQNVANTLLASFDVLKSLIGEVGGQGAHDELARRAVSARIAALVSELHEELTPKSSLEALPELSTLIGDESSTSPRRDVSRAPSVAALPSEPSEASSKASSPILSRPAAPSPVIGTLRPEEDLQVREAAAPLPRAARTPDATPSGRERRVGAETESSSVRVPIDKLDRLINLAGEVVIAQSMIAQQLVGDPTPEQIGILREVVAQMDRHCRELQERMLGARMLPIKTVFSRFNRLVRDLSTSTGKALTLVVSGEETELDKTVIEKIADPLTHLVRNAIDHGVEPPDERQRAGKPEQAQIGLSAYQKGGNIYIEVRDDGRGLNRERILAKARKVGLIAEGATPREDEIHELIFAPGFSTADQVTEISGRGVGMDVVKRNVEALRGSIAIETSPGLGTCFRIKLPLTLAILDGLGLRVGPETYLVPLVSVVESVQPRARDILTIANVGEVVEVRGEYLPLVRLYEVLGIVPEFTAPHEGLVMVLDDGTQRFAIQIDELIGQYQVVVKSLETNFQSVPGIASATILGDGRVALILDVSNLAPLARSLGGRSRSIDRSQTTKRTGSSA